MAVTQAQIDALTAAIASGERQVTIGSQSVTYRSIADLIEARNLLQTEFNNQQVADGTKTPRPKQSMIYMSGRGYD